MKRVQGWMPDCDLNRLLLGMQFKDDDDDLQRIQNCILKNTMDLNGILDYIQEESKKQNPNMENLQLALARLNEIAEKNPNEVAKNPRVVPLLQRIMSDPKLIWIVDKSDEAKTGPSTTRCRLPHSPVVACLSRGTQEQGRERSARTFGVLKTASIACRRVRSTEESFVEQDMKLLSNMLDAAKSPEDLCDENDGFTKLNLKHCEGIQAKFKNNPTIQAKGDNIQMKLNKIFPGSFKEEMADFTMTLDPFNDIVKSVVPDTTRTELLCLLLMVRCVRARITCIDHACPNVLKHQHSNTSNTNTNTHRYAHQETSPEWDDMEAKLTKGRDMVLNYQGNADEVDISVVKNLTDILKNAGKDPDIAERVITLLNHYGTNDENLKKIERAGGIEALIEALRQHPDNDRLAKALLLLLDKFCDHDVFKNRIGKAGAVEVILSACNAQSSAAKVANGRSLPKGWVAVRDPKSNKTYYYNTATRKSTWKKPKPDKPDLPGRYTAEQDETGRTYYKERKTGKIVWELPPEDALKMIQEGVKRDTSEHHLLLIQLLCILSKLTYGRRSTLSLPCRIVVLRT